MAGSSETAHRDEVYGWMVVPSLPPSLWHAYRDRRGARGGKCLSREARDWHDSAALYLARHRPRHPAEGVVRLEIVLVGRDRRRWDVENRVKLPSDLLTHMGFWGDDSQVWDLRVSREIGAEEETRLRISRLDG